MAACVENPGALRELAAGVVSGGETSTTLVERYLARIEVVQPIAEPWREVDGERALATAALRDEQAKRGEILGPLHGVPVAVKDIIDVDGLPTRCNCKAYEDRAPATADAEIVLALKAAGAVLLGKLHTTEFAFFDPSPARNPHNTDHTPGGSSSGSGAAIASGTVPLALGTQTMASVNRPAAYCGISAFKPTTRSICMSGTSVLAPSYDTVGFYGWSVDDAVYAYEAITPFGPLDATAAPARVVFLEDELITDVEPAMAQAVGGELARFADAGHRVERTASPVPLTRVKELHYRTMIFEAGRVLAHLEELPEGQVGTRILKAVADGKTIEPEQYLAERAELNALRQRFFATFTPTDVFYWPAAPGGAPEGIQLTGEPKYIAPWTTLGGPIVTMPTGVSDGDLPLGAILSGFPGTDGVTGAIARGLAL